MFGLLRFLVFALVLAAVVLAVLLFALRPVVNDTILSVAEDNPAALGLPFVKDLVRDDLGPALTTPVSSEQTQVEFVVEPGDTARSIANRLQDQGLIGDHRAFVFIAIDRGLSGELQQGTFVLRKDLTPDQLVSALLAPPKIKYVDIGLRPGLRLEQITAKLETLPLEMNEEAFYHLVETPPAALLADYPWLKTALADAPPRRVARGLPVGRDLPGAARHVSRRARPADAGQVRGERRRRAHVRPEGARPDLLPGAHTGLDRRARGPARR